MRKTITWVLYILMGVQIVLGCAYFVCNFTVEQQFRENIRSFLPMWAVCLIQLFFAALSVWYVSGKFGVWRNKSLRVYVCAFLLTVPYLLQMHMARLVWSAALSAFLWLFGLSAETVKSGLTGKRLTLLLVSWFLYGVICPDGLWLGGILLVTAAFWGKKNRKEHTASVEAERKRKNSGRAFYLGCAGLLTAGMIAAANLGLNCVFPEARSIYRENTLGAAAVSRLVWPNFGKNYYFWSDEVKAVLTEYEAVQISQRVDLVGEEFFPGLAEAYGKKRATELCLEMGYRCLMDRTRETVLEIGKDLKDYSTLPFAIGRNLRGKGVSLTAWNYGRMREHTPILVKYYFRYGTFELAFLLLGSFLLCGFQVDDRSSQLPERRKLPAQWKFLGLTAILYAVWYTMRSNFPIDYKMALPILFIWYLISVSGVLYQKPDERRQKWPWAENGGNEENR